MSEFLFFFYFFGPIAALYAIPVAIPVIGVTEWKKRGEWWIFALVGLLFGVAMAALFTELPFDWTSFANSLFIMPIVLAWTITYWAVAWHWFPPKLPSHSPMESPLHDH
ncbi:MAG: hypothetical protein AAGH57_00535 [Pseudomonadota bacterium]